MLRIFYGSFYERERSLKDVTCIIDNSQFEDRLQNIGFISQWRYNEWA